MPKISVIVPVYNVEPYIRECLDSLVGQTYTDFEVILVDDASPDGCPAICDEYAAKDGRFKVIHHPENRKSSGARNTGLDHATGQYITFADPDDYCSPDYLEVMLALMDEHKPDLVVTKYSKMGKERQPQNSGRVEFLSQQDVFNIRRVGYAVYCKLFSHSIIKEQKLRFDEELLSYSDDSLFTLSYLQHVRQIACSPRITYHVRKRPLSATAWNYNLARELTRETAAQKMLDIFVRSAPKWAFITQKRLVSVYVRIALCYGKAGQGGKKREYERKARSMARQLCRNSYAPFSVKLLALLLSTFPKLYVMYLQLG
jgi:glycosyltransferase involved in cell wall biosynthesis